MRVDDLFITEDISVLDAMRKLDETGMGVLFVAPEGVLRAVVTDGDIRRYILKSLPLEGPVREAANYSPYALPMEARARAAWWCPTTRTGWSGRSIFPPRRKRTSCNSCMTR